MKHSMFDEREKLMVSPSGGIPHLRKAHFFNPIVFAVEGPTLKLSSIPFLSESDCPLDVAFHGCNGWRDQQIKWRAWVERMERDHHHVWKAAGIYKAVTSLVYRVHTYEKLIFGLVERWCCETNTFIFSARLFEPDVPTRYLKWWRKEILCLADGAKTYQDVSDLSTEYPDVPPGFSPMVNQLKVETLPDVPC